MKLFPFVRSSLYCCALSAAAPLLAQSFSTTVKEESKQSVPLNEAIIFFTPPANWQVTTDRSVLSASLKMMAIGKGQHAFPPSMNLATQPYKGTLKQYLKNVKAINESQRTEWKDLGLIRTEAGNASLSQVDRKTQWGEERLMHAILLKNEVIYIVTASALKEEFSSFYKDFFNSIRSLRVSKDLYEMIPSLPKRKEFKQAVQDLQTRWRTLVNRQRQEQPDANVDQLKQTIFEGESFQKNEWTPFKEMIKQKLNDLGSEWHSFATQKIEDDLFDAP